MNGDEGIVVVGRKPHAMVRPAEFYAGVRKITGPLSQAQIETISALLEEAYLWPASWLAYGLATAWHEARLIPQREWGRGAGHRYAQPGARMKPIPHPPLYGGQSPYGRGLVQLTWCDNYEWADKALDLDRALLENFDLALRPDVAVGVLVKGMEQGAFTGRSLKDYLPDRLGTPEQFGDARRIINGTDKAERIAGYAQAFQDAIEAGGWGQ